MTAHELTIKEIDVGKDYTEFPAGRHRVDGRYSGQAFREVHLTPALQEHEVVRILLDGTIGYGSSFLEEAFGGLVRSDDFTTTNLKGKLTLVSEDRSLIHEIWGYINDAVRESNSKSSSRQ